MNTEMWDWWQKWFTLCVGQAPPEKQDESEVSVSIYLCFSEMRGVGSLRYGGREVPHSAVRSWRPGSRWESSLWVQRPENQGAPYLSTQVWGPRTRSSQVRGLEKTDLLAPKERKDAPFLCLSVPLGPLTDGREGIPIHLLSTCESLAEIPSGENSVLPAVWASLQSVKLTHKIAITDNLAFGFSKKCYSVLPSDKLELRWEIEIESHFCRK